MKTIHHIKTGGTIGGCVPEYKEIEFLSEIFSDMVDFDKFFSRSLNIYATYAETTICHKDSRDINDEDRARIVSTVVCEYEKGTKRFLITHGTYTMPETGVYLMKHLPVEVLKDVKVIITGSMFPWTVFGSDAPINLGAALGILLNTDDKRITVCMHGKLFDPKKMKKDTENWVFIED